MITDHQRLPGRGQCSILFFLTEGQGKKKFSVSRIPNPDPGFRIRMDRCMMYLCGFFLRVRTRLFGYTKKQKKLCIQPKLFLRKLLPLPQILLLHRFLLPLPRTLVIFVVLQTNKKQPDLDRTPPIHGALQRGT